MTTTARSVLCNRGQVGCSSADRLARIEQMIEHYRLANKRRLDRRAIALWRKTEARQALVELEKSPDRVH